MIFVSRPHMLLSDHTRQVQSFDDVSFAYRNLAYFRTYFISELITCSFNSSTQIDVCMWIDLFVYELHFISRVYKRLIMIILHEFRNLPETKIITKITRFKQNFVIL